MDEQIDNIEIEVEDGENVLFRVDGVHVITAHHQLGVVDQIHGKDNGTQSTVYHYQQMRRIKDDEYRGDYKRHSHHKEDGAPRGEIVTRLRSVDAQGEANHAGDGYCHQDIVDLVLNHEYGQDHRLDDGENSQKYNVYGKRAPQLLKAHHQQHRYDQERKGYPEHYRILHHEHLHRGVE